MTITPNFLLRLMAKDLGYAIDEASQPWPYSTNGKLRVCAVFKHAIAKGYGEQDFSAVVKAFRHD